MEICKIYEYETIDSTNDEAVRLAETGAKEGTLIISKEQTKGHGRLGRTWHSPSGENIYMTLILRPEIPPEKVSMITLLMGLGVSRGIDRIIKEEWDCEYLQTRIKWPNDLLINGKKVCGILTGMKQDFIGKNFVYVGVGINLTEMEYPEEIRSKATSLESALKAVGCKKVTINEDIRRGLIKAITQEFKGLYREFLKEQKLEFIKSEYNNKLINLNEMVRVNDPHEPYEGICSGITNHGELMVETGEYLKLVMSGEVSVRASDGSYV